MFGLVERLLDEPWSRYRAKLIGGEEWRGHLGWGPAEYLHAALIDAVQMNTSVTAAHGGKRKPKVPPQFPRPQVAKQKPARTLADLNVGQIETMLNG